jgi:predicted outer membrane protein
VRKHVCFGMGVLVLATLGACRPTPPPASATSVTAAEVGAPTGAAPEQVATAAAPARPLAAVATMSDAQILGVLHELIDGELDLAQVARRRGRSDGVRQYAAMLTVRYERDRARLRGIEGRTGRTAETTTDAAAHVRDELARAIDRLRLYERADFDSLYLDAEARNLRDVLHTLDRQLLPAAKNDEVRRLCAASRRHVAGQLANVEALARELAPPPDGAGPAR